jgi:hypothetical protein
MSVYQRMADGMGDTVAEAISEALPEVGTNWAQSGRESLVADRTQGD